MTKPITAVLAGAGNRGAEAYGRYAQQHPAEIQFVAVAEPHPQRRARFAQTHGIPAARQFTTWEELFAAGQLADVAFITTQDQLHTAPTLAALELGYDILLEKPMAPTLAENIQLVQAAERAGRLLQIGHVLRYTTFFSKLHEIIKSGRLGKIISVEHRENVSYWHMSHSFVRGNWRNRALSSPMILAKCCHDLDILYWNLGPCAQLNSFGSLLHYRAANAPAGAPERCTAGCPVADTCPWNAVSLYQKKLPLQRHLADPEAIANYYGWPISVITEDYTPEGIRHALETGPYGRCVYHCDNDVVDNQIVNLQMESGATVALFMQGHSHREGRTMRYDGTRATLRGAFFFDEQRLEIHDHLTGQTEVIDATPGPIGGSGHGGGDAGLMRAFIHAVRHPETALTTARESLESHLMAFAADQARVENQIINLAAFRRQAEQLTA